jgi:3'-5' exoribonuclease
MKTQFVDGLREAMDVRDAFLVQSKALNVGRTGKPYLALVLADRSGTIEARVWDGADEIAARFVQGDVVSVEGRTVEYQGKLQVSAQTLVRIDPATIDPLDFLPRTPRDVEAMWAELVRLCEAMTSRPLRDLLRLFFEDEEFVRAFKTAPAAKGIHHVYLGGLLEHTLSLVKLSRLVASHYTAIHGDLLVAASVLHDAGKTRELRYDTGFDYTAEGRLIGHIVLGIQWVDEKARRIEGFPAETLLHLKHVIASHHGEPTFGAVKRPKTPEAVVFHHLDNIDAKMWTYLTAIESERGKPGEMTSFHRVLDLFLYKGDAAARGEGGYGFHVGDAEPTETPEERPADPPEERSTPRARIADDGSLDLFAPRKK